MKNPFEYEQARNFSDQLILELYIPSFNYSRFIHSRRNVFLVGERGTGKSMALLYNSFALERLKAAQRRAPMDFGIASIHVDCNTTLTHRQEYDLLDPFRGSVISEHSLIIQIMYAVVDTLSKDEALVAEAEAPALKEELSYSLDIEFPDGIKFFDSVKVALQKQNTLAQRAINSPGKEAFYNNAGTFSTWVLPLLRCLRRIPKLTTSHFSLMIDDAHLLNPHQNKLLNSWMAYRDNSLFSFKVATTKIDRPPLQTSTGGMILEGHDFTTIDMELPYQNKFSNYGKMARDIIKRRLEKIGIEKTPEEYFPINQEFERNLNECKEIVRRDAESKFGTPEGKQVTDYIYKYYRVEYFRRRSPKANIPPYSGFEILVHISTGVIRNLLQPCFKMYEHALSELESTGRASSVVDYIPPPTQTKIIQEMSLEKWAFIQNGMEKNVPGCSGEKAKQISNLFDNLAILFRKRLESHKSEPRAITFTISDTDSSDYSKVIELLNIAQRAQILYAYFSSAKDDGKKETYYVPNRILWPSRHLDPVGQHARVSIKAGQLWDTALNNTQIPMGNDNPIENNQLEIFDELS